MFGLRCKESQAKPNMHLRPRFRNRRVVLRLRVLIGIARGNDLGSKQKVGYGLWIHYKTDHEEDCERTLYSRR